MLKTIRTLALSAIALSALTSAAFADDGHGPDAYRVVNVAPDDVLNIRSLPSASAHKVGEIPYNGTDIAYDFCIGTPTFAEWTEMNDAERDAAARLEWCRITYNGTTGWAAGRFLGE